MEYVAIVDLIVKMIFGALVTLSGAIAFILKYDLSVKGVKKTLETLSEETLPELNKHYAALNEKMFDMEKCFVSKSEFQHELSILHKRIDVGIENLNRNIKKDIDLSVATCKLTCRG